jgi:hypothetical protein
MAQCFMCAKNEEKIALTFSFSHGKEHNFSENNGDR